MNTVLNIGPEETHEPDEALSQHVVNLKQVDSSKKEEAHAKVTLNLKDEIRSQKKATGRICIVGELPRSKQGLGRLPVVAAALLTILVLNLGQVVFLGKTRGEEALALAQEGFVTLKGASQSLMENPDSAKEDLLFKDAQRLFDQAEAKASFLIQNQSSFLQEPAQVSSLRHLLAAGEEMAELGTQLSAIREALKNFPKEGSVTTYLRTLSTDHLEPATLQLHSIRDHLHAVDLSGTPYEDQFADYRDKLDTLTSWFDLWGGMKDPLLSSLGERYVQHYLILLMNNDELRPGGGFIGSVAVAELNDGRLANLDFHDVYDYDNLYFEKLEVPLREIRHLAPDWRLRDSNTSPDFPTSAQQALDLWGKEGGQGVDGVIAVNLGAAQGLVEALGELKIPSLEKPLKADTFPTVLSALVESKTFGEDSPKTILQEVLHAFLSASSDFNSKVKLSQQLLGDLQKKQILVYHRDPAVQSMIESFHLDGSLPKLGELTTDFVLPVFINRGANKTDRFMESQLFHDTKILEDGTVIDALTIKRSHTFTDSTLAWIKSVSAEYGVKKWTDQLEKVMGKDSNKTGLRIYLPEGAQMLEVRGDVHKDDFQLYYDPAMDLSYYALDQNIEPGSSQEFTMMYSLPWKMNRSFQNYDFQLFKQPGLSHTSFEKTVSAPSEILLEKSPQPSESRPESDYVLGGNFKGDVSLRLLYR
jgi:hypothetical protein